MSLTRTIARIAVISILLLSVGTSLGAQEGPVDYDALIIEMLEGYQELMSERLDSDVTDLTGETWYIISQAISKGYLRFTVDPETIELIHGAQFLVAPESNQPYIFVSRTLLDTREQYPSLSYALLSGAFREAYLFFRDTAMWRIARADVLESTFMQMEKYAAEVAMIRDRLVPSGFLITPYEAYILDSFETDGMVSGLMFLNGQSLPMAQLFGEIRVNFEEDRDADKLRDATLAAGKELLDARNELPADAADQDRIPLATAIHSWLEISPSVISRIYNIDRPENPLTFPEVLEREDEYRNLRRLLEASRTRDLPVLEHFVDEAVRGFSAPN